MAEQSAASTLTGVTPYITIGGGKAAEAAEFYKRAFGATEVMRMPGEGGKLMHCHMALNGGAILFSDAFDGPGATPAAHTLHLQVDDAAKWWERATKAGCTVTMPLEQQFWGDHYGKVRDPFGHEWSIGSAKK